MDFNTPSSDGRTLSSNQNLDTLTSSGSFFSYLTYFTYSVDQKNNFYMASGSRENIRICSV